jgi:biotin synthase-related radical SAM superfamily protein
VHSLPEKNCPSHTGLPEHIRVSLGTAIVLGLLEGKLDAEPSTAYLMTYKTGKCSANCGFCPQARASKSSTELLSRVSWPTIQTSSVITGLAKGAKDGKIRRICIQALNYPDVFAHLEALVKEIKKRSEVAVSVSCQPLNRENIVRLANAGVDRLGIALDAATEGLFNQVKGEDAGGAYTWQGQFRQLSQALDVFGEGHVSTHVIVGLGETDKEAVEVIQRCVDLGVLPALFAFTPVRGTALEHESPPKLESYRRVQLSRYLIVNGKTKLSDMQFSFEGNIKGYGLTNEALNAEVESGVPFQTSGCPDCNRPFYNEKPSGPLYNYPKKPNKKEIEKIKKELT